MDSVELCKKSIALAVKDKEYLNKIKKITVSLTMKYKDAPKKNFSILIKNGKMSTGKPVAKADFEIETKEKDFYKVVSGETPGLMAMATGKMKITKGDLTELNKLIPTLGGLTEFAKKYLKGE